MAPIETTAVTIGTKSWDNPGRKCPVSILRDLEPRCYPNALPAELLDGHVASQFTP